MLFVLIDCSINFDGFTNRNLIYERKNMETVVAAIAFTGSGIFTSCGSGVFCHCLQFLAQSTQRSRYSCVSDGELRQIFRRLLLPFRSFKDPAGGPGNRYPLSAHGVYPGVFFL